MKWLMIVAIILIDQFSKWLVITRLKEIGTIPVIENVFHLHYLENRGAAFGLLQNQRLFFLMITLAITAGILWYLYRYPQTNKLLTLSLCLISGGAVGNFIDRAAYGYVVDFLDFQIWPVFNIADSAIVIGQGLLIYYILKDFQAEKMGGSP